LDPTLTCDRYGISSFIYRARKPFHPKRLFDLIHDKFIVLQNVDQEEEEEEEEEGEGSGGSEDEDMGGTADENEDMQEDSETEMEDDLAGKDFAREIDPKVTLCLPMNR
jgi:U3 small nucleolar ribonucleoprotein component